jgi:putative transposase
MRRGFLYLVAIRSPALVCLQTMSGVYWYSRKVLSWRLSNSMDAAFCVEALEEALAKHGKPEIFNTDQGSQFTSGNWIDVLTDARSTSAWTAKGA